MIGSALTASLRAGGVVSQPLLHGRSAALTTEAVGEIADKINRIYARGGLQTAIEIGRYVLSVLAPSAAGETECAKTLAKSSSYRALSRHPSLAVSHSFLWTAVSVALQYNRLPSETRVLPLSHHRLLVSVRDPQQKQLFAQQSYRDGWSKRELSSRIRAWAERNQSASQVRRGRPAIPEAVRDARALITLVDKLAQLVENGELPSHHEEVESTIHMAIERLTTLRMPAAPLSPTHETTNAGGADATSASSLDRGLP